MKRTLLLAAFLAFGFIAIHGSVPNPFPYSTAALYKTTLAEFATTPLTAGSAATTVNLGAVSKQLFVANEGSYGMRICDDGSTPTAAGRGVLVNAGERYTNPNWCSDSFKVIRSASNDTTYTYRSGFSNE